MGKDIFKSLIIFYVRAHADENETNILKGTQIEMRICTVTPPAEHRAGGTPEASLASSPVRSACLVTSGKLEERRLKKEAKAKKEEEKRLKKDEW